MPIDQSTRFKILTTFKDDRESWRNYCTDEDWSANSRNQWQLRKHFSDRRLIDIVYRRMFRSQMVYKYTLDWAFVNEVSYEKMERKRRRNEVIMRRNIIHFEFLTNPKEYG